VQLPNFILGIVAGVGVGAPKATGGTITLSGGFYYHTFTANGTFTPLASLNVEALVIAGGASGGCSYAGGVFSAHRLIV